MQFLSDRHVWYLRYILLVSTSFSVFSRVIISYVEDPTPLHIFRFYTIQSNFMLFIWVSLAVLWKNKPDNYRRLTGFVKGALTTYITITFIVFFLLIEPLYDPVGLDWWTSLFNHYLNPWMFIVDFVASEKEPYQWNWSIFWLAYPLAYLSFAMVWGAIYGEYLYFFLNIDELGVAGFAIWVIILTCVFIFFGLFYTFLNRKYLTPSDS